MVSQSLGILIFGCGGHAVVVHEVVERLGGYDILGFVDVEPSMSTLLGRPVFDQAAVLFGQMSFGAAILGIGENHRRRAVAEAISAAGLNIAFPILADPSAIISRSAEIGPGTVIMPGAIVNPRTTIGAHCIINTAAVVEHDCHIHDYASIGPRAAVGGGGDVGRASLIGIGATVRHGIAIGADVVLGAGACAVQDLKDHTVYIGVPARPVAIRSEGDPMLATPRPSGAKVADL